MGWFASIESPMLCAASIWVWRQFSDLDLSEAKHSRFSSLRACFIRELKPGARTFATDSQWLLSPCDTIVGRQGCIDDTTLLQAKGRTYTLEELLGDVRLANSLHNGRFVTLRITSSMYHRFHAPDDLVVDEVIYIPGDAWNVNGPALARVDRLFCKNERAVIRCRLQACGTEVILVAVAAVLVAGIRLHCADLLLHTGYRGPMRIPCERSFARGEEMGWFEHGSTILVLTPEGLASACLADEGSLVRVGQPLLQRL